MIKGETMDGMQSNGMTGSVDGPAVPGLLDRRGAARFLGGISVSLLDQLVSRGELPAIRIGRRVAFDPGDLLAWARSRKTTRAEKKSAIPAVQT